MVITQDARLSRQTDRASDPRALGVPAEAGSVYELALTHRSHAFENDLEDHNERLEFLGDAVLGVVVSELVYRSYPDVPEGDMARLRATVVNTSALAEVGRSLGFGEHLLLGKGEEASGGRDKDSLLANAFEALVGATYLDKGMDAVRAALEPIFMDRLAAAAAGDRFDSKTALQEIAVKEAGHLPTYETSASGPDHDKRFHSEVFVDDRALGTGSGRSKKEAEQNAARAALTALDDGEISEDARRADARLT